MEYVPAPVWVFLCHFEKENMIRAIWEYIRELNGEVKIAMVFIFMITPY